MQQKQSPSFTSLPIRINPLPWEDFASFISRVARQMGYKNPAWILHPEEVSHIVQPFTLCHLHDQTDYRFFEQMLQLDEETLYQLTLHRFALRMQAAELDDGIVKGEINRPLLRRHIFQSFFQSYTATRVCSQCLAEESAYGLLQWSIQPVVSCLRHKIFLTSTCPICHQTIPALRPSLTCCPRCNKGDYRRAPVVPLPKDIMFHTGQALILDRLGIEVPIPEDGAILASPLLKLLPWQYFQLLDAFRCTLGPVFPDAPFLRIETEQRSLLRQHVRPHSEFTLLEWSVFITTFHEIFSSWPDQFFTFLKVFPQSRESRGRKRDLTSNTGVQRDFGVFYEKWLYKRLAHSAFAFLHEAFEAYLNRHYTGGEITGRLLPFRDTFKQQEHERPYLTKVQTRAVLGISEQVLQSLLGQGILRTFKKPINQAGKRTMYLIEKESIEALQKEWNNLLSLDVLTRSRFGVTRAIVLSLEQEGLLLPSQGLGMSDYRKHLYSQEDVQQFEHNILSHTVSISECPINALPLPKVSTQIGVALIEIIKEVLNGRLTLLELRSNEPLFQRLMVPHDQISDFLREYKQQQYEERGLLTIDQAARCIGVGERVLRRWVQCGLLKSEKLVIGGRQPPLLFQRVDMETFHHTYIFINEVADQLRVVPSTVRKYVQRGILHSALDKMAGKGGGRLIFRRDEIKAYVASRPLQCDNVRS